MGRFDELLENFDGALVILGAVFFTFFDAGEFVICVFVGELLSGGEFFCEGSGPFFMRHGGDGAHVENDVFGPKLLGHIERFEGFAVSFVTFVRVVGGEFVGIWRVNHDFRRGRKVVVHADAFEFPSIKSPLDAGEFCDGHAVREF